MTALHLMQMEVTWQNRFRWHTEFSADSAEWCPVEPYHDVMVCGTYQLHKSDEEKTTTKQTRLGKIHLFVIDEEITELSPIQTIDTSGILDQKWCYHTLQDYPVLAVVTSDGHLQFYRLLDDNGVISLKLWFSHSIDSNVLALSVDWSTNKTRMDEPSVVVSDSAGNVTVLKIVGNGVQKIGQWEAHGFEVWIAAFNYWSPDLFYSGGDDCIFKCFDVRVKDAVSLNRSHEAGVTSIRSHINVEHQLLTGSYDEKVRLWDARRLKSCISEKDVSGGVWRLKWHPNDSNTVLAACMYGGFRVLHVGAEINVVCEYLEHGSIAYGADWSFERHLVATCSFYDCSLHISDVTV